MIDGHFTGKALAHLLQKDVVGLCKKEMGDNPFVGPLLRQVDTIFIERDDKDQSHVLKQALAVLADGRSLVIAALPFYVTSKAG